VAIESAFVGITGASGAPYAVRLVEILAENDVFVEVCASKMGEKVLAYEMAGLSTKKLAETYDVKRYAPDDLFAPPASGTSVPDAAVIAPASVSSLKERKRLVVLEREMPYSLVHIKNMAAVTEAGGTIISAAPGFYNHPETMEDLIDFVIGKVLDAVGLRGHELVERWGHKRRG
jgi:4-hydroxy-3-polyprenylbenzoate decarboxylase